jgi:quinoprotein glucose dehydrogenase
MYILVATAGLWALSIAGGCDSKPAQQEVFHHTVALRANESINALPLLDSSNQVRADSTNTVLHVDPALPAGMEFDQQTGRVTGTVTLPVGISQHTIVLQNNASQLEFVISLSVDHALPDAFSSLLPGYSAELIVANADIPVRMAIAPDGRLFYAELQTGHIRIVHPDAGLDAAPFAALDVATGNEKGIIGFALDPQFNDNGYVYVHATVATDPADSGYEAEIIRLSAVNNRAVNETTLVRHLAAADLHNGGDIVFDQHGNLFIGRGDITIPALAQTPGSTAGKILRYTRDGGIPADNPYPGDPEWARGLRNTFALAVHPVTGDLFGADAGPNNDDKLNYLVAGKNFLWGMENEPQGSSVGYSVRTWADVITPTSLLFHSGQGGFTDFKHQLFTSTYNFEDIRVIHLTGSTSTDFVREQTFASFHPDNFNNKPLHMIEAPDGSLYVSTFNAIYRIRAAEATAAPSQD